MTLAKFALLVNTGNHQLPMTSQSKNDNANVCLVYASCIGQCRTWHGEHMFTGKLFCFSWALKNTFIQHKLHESEKHQALDLDYFNIAPWICLELNYIWVSIRCGQQTFDSSLLSCVSHPLLIELFLLQYLQNHGNLYDRVATKIFEDYNTLSGQDILIKWLALFSIINSLTSLPPWGKILLIESNYATHGKILIGLPLDNRCFLTIPSKKSSMNLRCNPVILWRIIESSELKNVSES